MNKLKYITALCCAKLLITLIKAGGKSKATSAPGMLAMKICPDFIKHAAHAREKILAVTGTNGKTTTTGLLAHIVKTNGKQIIHNTDGANMLTGIATALIKGNEFGKNPDYLIFECDEAYLRKLFEFADADYLLVTNLFRDQLDRYGELDTTYKKIKEATALNKNLKVIINADDPTLENIAGESEKIYYGLEKIEYDYETKTSGAPAESTVCPVCGKPLVYEERFYAHLGKYSCECGYKKPSVKYAGSVKIYASYFDLTIKYSDKISKFTVNLPGLYNVYNAAGAISEALELGISEDIIARALETYSSVFGRAETTFINGKKTLIQLIKNPVGASEVIRQIQGFDKSKLVVILNDNYADGRDVSWIWDADFELLKDYKNTIIVSGIRADDAALRLKYAGVDTKLLIVEKNIKTAIDMASSMTKDDETLLILPTYTALLKMQTLFTK